MKIENPPGAQFEILVDGKPRSYRDIKAVAIASAEFLKSRNPLSEVAVKDLQTGEGDRSSQGVGRLMALTMRPTGLGSGAYQDNIDYNVFGGEWLIGRIYERNGFPDEVRLFWPLHREPFCQTAPQRAWREQTSLSLRLVSSIRFAEAVLNGPAVLASVERLISPRPIVPTVSTSGLYASSRSMPMKAGRETYRRPSLPRSATSPIKRAAI